MKTPLVVLACLSSVAATAAPTGALHGIFHLAGKIDECELVTIDISTGANTSTPTTACEGNTQAWPSFAALSEAPGAPTLIIAVEGAAAVVAVDAQTGAATRLARLANNASDPIIGLVTLKQPAGAFLVTANGVWSVSKPGGAPVRFATIDTSAFSEPVCTHAQDGGTGGAGRVFIASQREGGIIVVDMGAPASRPKVLKGLPNGAMDLCYDAARDALLQMQSYTLYSRPSTGTTSPKQVTRLPDGPGFPRCARAFVFLIFRVLTPTPTHTLSCAVSTE